MCVAPVFYVFHYLETGNHWNMFSDSHTKKQNLKKKMKEGKNIFFLHKNLVILNKELSCYVLHKIFFGKTPYPKKKKS